MKLLVMATLLATSGLIAGAAQAQASSSTKKPAAAAKKPAAVAAKKPAAAKKTSTTARRTTATRAAAAAAVPAAAVAAGKPLSELEQAIARNVHTGSIQCELGQNVTVTADEQNPGYFYITAGKQRYYMYPVESRTGAIRMEDAGGSAMWLQLGNKSMLLNQKLGQRVADECTVPVQREFAAHMKNTQQPGLLDGPTTK